jgi:1,4-alpha-glucan branching enzyme
MRGHLALLLHAHLPFVRHPENPRHLEEHWLFEAITDSYLPLLGVLRNTAARGSPFRVTISLSPTLLSMLSDPLLGERYLDYLSRLERLCERLEASREIDLQRRELTRFYAQRLARLRAFYLEELGGDLIAAWAELADHGTVELMTTAATHGYLPLLRSRPGAVRAQLRVAYDHFLATFGRPPEGLWLPECGYYSGLEREVSAAGFRYCVVDAHGLQQAWPRPRHGVYAPVSAQGAVALFGRDPDSAREVWCPETGYPGHSLYREFHRDLGYEGNVGLLEDFLPPGVGAAPTGLKYHRITGGQGPKGLYDPVAARERAELDARSYVENRCRRLASLTFESRPPIAVAPYDAELFGHWWFEGPDFLEGVIRGLDGETDIRPVTLGEHLDGHGIAEDVRPAPSSWGERGYNRTWLRPETGWVYLHLHQSAGELEELAQGYDRTLDLGRTSRLLRQAARSLLLAQSSDWTFLMGRGAGSAYSEARLREQLSRFRFLIGALRGGRIREEQLVALETMDNLFPDLDLSHFG